MKSKYSKVRKAYKSLERLWGKRVRIGNFTLAVDPENSQPYILKAHPEHGGNLLRLAKAARSKYGKIRIFDIGANFGDTVASLLTDDSEYSIIAIEGDGPSFDFLSKNFSAHEHVSLHKLFLGEHDADVSVSKNKEGGSLRLVSSKTSGNSSIETLTLDRFIGQHPDYRAAKLLKIDTDGYDNKIIRGAKEYLTATKPVIFFEYDKKYLTENNDAGIDIFDFLEKLGYAEAVFYDNVGRFIQSVHLAEKQTLCQLDRYITDRRGLIPYYDIAVFHSSDSDIATSFISAEENRS